MGNIDVLITDDHDLFRQGLEKLLRRKHFVKEIYHAANGKEAVEKVELYKPDLIFMDVRMPILDGIEATRIIARQNPNVKIIALTMMEDRESVVKMFKAGAKGYLLKNTNMTEIETAIKDIWDGKRYYSKELTNVFLETDITMKQRQKVVLFKDEITEREIEIIRLICQGFKNKEIAEILFLSDRTIEGHRARIYDRLDAKSLVDIVFFAIENGIVEKRNY